MGQTVHTLARVGWCLVVKWWGKTRRRHFRAAVRANNIKVAGTNRYEINQHIPEVLLFAFAAASATLGEHTGRDSRSEEKGQKNWKTRNQLFVTKNEKHTGKNYMASERMYIPLYWPCQIVRGVRMSQTRPHAGWGATTSEKRILTNFDLNEFETDLSPEKSYQTHLGSINECFFIKIQVGTDILQKKLGVPRVVRATKRSDGRRHGPEIFWVMFAWRQAGQKFGFYAVCILAIAIASIRIRTRIYIYIYVYIYIYIYNYN